MYFLYTTIKFTPQNTILMLYSPILPGYTLEMLVTSEKAAKKQLRMCLIVRPSNKLRELSVLLSFQT